MSEINIQHHRSPGKADDIGGLEIQVNQIVMMQIVQRRTQLKSELRRIVLVQPFGPWIRRDRVSPVSVSVTTIGPIAVSEVITS